MLDNMEATNPIIILKLRPLIVLVNMSLPIQSVPKICSKDGGCIFMLKFVGKLASVIHPQMKMTSKTKPVSAIVNIVFCLRFRLLNKPLLYHGSSLIILTPQSWVNILVNQISDEITGKYKNCTDDYNSKQ